MFRVIRRHLAPPLGLVQRIAGLGATEVVGDGASVRLSDGRTVIDFGSYATTLLGHRQPDVLAAVAGELERMPTSTRTLANPTTAAFAATLVHWLGMPRLTRVWLGLNGGDAVEAVLKLARAQTGRQRVLAVRGGFHGKSMGALAVTWARRYRAPIEPLLAGVTHIAPGDPQAVEREAARGDVAALIFEPIQGENGIISLDPGVLLRWIADAHRFGAFVVADEIQTGTGRVCRAAMSAEYGLPVDAVLLGKSLGGGVMPLSAAVCSEELYRPLAIDPFLHTTTFSGHPLSCAAGLAALKVIDELRDVRTNLAASMRPLLTGLRARHADVLLEVRGQGLLWGLRFRSPEVAGEVLTTACQRGLVLSPCLGAPEIIRLLPPIVTTAGQLEDAVAILDLACRQAAVDTRARTVSEESRG